MRSIGICPVEVVGVVLFMGVLAHRHPRPDVDFLASRKPPLLDLFWSLGDEMQVATATMLAAEGPSG
jgi:hypothetical protein